MPIVVTMTAISLLRGAAQQDSLFLDVAALRERLDVVLAGESDTVRQQANALSGELEAALASYDRAMNAGVGAYIDASYSPDVTTQALQAGFEPFDSERNEALHAVVLVREGLLALLSAEQWGQVFA